MDPIDRQERRQGRRDAAARRDQRQPQTDLIEWEGATKDGVHRWSVLATLPQLREMNASLTKLIGESS